MVDRHPIDAPDRWRDIVRELSRFVHRLRHDAQKIFAIRGRREPLGSTSLPFAIAQRRSRGVEVQRREHADATVEFAIREPETVRNPVAFEDLVPALYARLAIAHV